jgi:hypothetical protein
VADGTRPHAKPWKNPDTGRIVTGVLSTLRKVYRIEATEYKTLLGAFILVVHGMHVSTQKCIGDLKIQP